MTPTHVGITTLTSWTQINESAHTNYLIHIVKEHTRTPEFGAGQPRHYTPLYIRVNRPLAEIRQPGGKLPPTPSRCVLPAGNTAPSWLFRFDGYAGEFAFSHLKHDSLSGHDSLLGVVQAFAVETNPTLPNQAYGL